MEPQHDPIAWLLSPTSDPSIRWQVHRDLLSSPSTTSQAQRALIAREGWGAALLARRDADGQWAGGACFPRDFDGDFAKAGGQPWTPTLPTLCLLRDMGVDPAEPALVETVARVRENCRWEHAEQRFFEGEVEPCINGRTVALGAYFGGKAAVDVGGIVERLLGEQLEDGGWNCEVENGSVRSSFNTTICVLEGLLEYERWLAKRGPVGNAHGDYATSSAVDLQQLRASRRRAEAYLLDRSLFRRKSTGEVIDEDFLKLAFPWQWHYDILRGLDYFRAAADGERPDPRLDEAVQVLRQKQLPDGTWPLEHVYRGAVYFEMDEGVGKPSRWVTLLATRVLRWVDAAS